MEKIIEGWKFGFGMVFGVATAIVVACIFGAIMIKVGELF